MGAQVSNNPNIVLSNPNEEIIEYQGYEDFAIVEIAKNDLLKQEKLKPNPSLNNHSGGSSIGKYESEHNLHKCKEKNREENKENNEEERLKSESKFPHNQDQINPEEEIKNEKKEENNNNNGNNIIVDNEEKEVNEEEKKIENNNENNNENQEEEKKIEEQNNNNVNMGNENINVDDDKDKIKIEDNLNKEENVTNEVQNQIQKEDINNINNNNINNNNDNENDNNIEQNNIDPNTKINENQENMKIDNVDNENNKNEKNNNNKNDDFAPRKIILPNINTIISEKVLEEGAGNELLFMSNLNKMVHISIKERVKYSEKFCITTKDNFLIYETRENYIKVKKPLAIIPINSIKNVVLFKLTKKVINYDHFYIEFQLDENNKNNVYNQVDTFYINDLDNTNNENKSDTALVMFKTEEKNLAKKWYVLLKYLIELKLKN